jgi:hypothetical protein
MRLRHPTARRSGAIVAQGAQVALRFAPALGLTLGAGADETAIRLGCKLRDRSVKRSPTRKQQGRGNELQFMRSSGRLYVLKKLFRSARWRIQKAHAFDPR